MADDTTDVTVAEAFEFFADRSATEEENFAEENEADIPDHAEVLVADSATDLLKTVTSIEMAFEMADEGEDVAEDAMADSLAEGVVDLLAAVGTLKHERDIDIAAAVEERIEFIRDYEAFEQAMQDADDEEEKVETMDEYLTEELADEMGMGQQPLAPPSAQTWTTTTTTTTTSARASSNMTDKTDEIKERVDDGAVGGTVDDDSGAVLTLDTTGDGQPSEPADDSDSTSDESSNGGE